MKTQIRAAFATRRKVFHPVLSDLPNA